MIPNEELLQIAESKNADYLPRVCHALVAAQIALQKIVDYRSEGNDEVEQLRAIAQKAL